MFALVSGYEWDVGHFKEAQRPPVDCFKSTEFGLQYNEVEPSSLHAQSKCKT